MFRKCFVLAIAIVAVLALAGCNRKAAPIGEVAAIGQAVASEQTAETVETQTASEEAIEAIEAIEASVLADLWEEEDAIRIIHYFSPGNNYRMGMKESSWDKNSKWELNGNVLKLTTEYVEEDFEAIWLDNPIIEEIIVTMINRDKIILNYPDGKQTNLIRSFDQSVNLPTD